MQQTECTQRDFKKQIEKKKLTLRKIVYSQVKIKCVVVLKIVLEVVS